MTSRTFKKPRSKFALWISWCLTEICRQLYIYVFSTIWTSVYCIFDKQSWISSKYSSRFLFLQLTKKSYMSVLILSKWFYKSSLSSFRSYMIVLCICYREIILSMNLMMFCFICNTRLVSFKNIKTWCWASTSYLSVACVRRTLKLRAKRRLDLWRNGILCLFAGTESRSWEKPRFVMKILY
jgi:hypothetical protein